MIRLDIAEQGRIRTVDLSDGRHVVGRALDADLRLESADVSRRHALLEVHDGRLWVQDLGSLWGTFVGPQRLHEGDREPLPDGALLRVAQVELWSHGQQRPQIPEVSGAEFDSTGLPERRRVSLSGVEEFPSRRRLSMLRSLFRMFTTEDEGQAIEQEACRFVRTWVDLDRVCLFEALEPGELPPIRGWWSRGELDPGKLLISEHMVREVLDTGEAMIWARDPFAEGVDPGDSLHRFGIQSAMAVPINAPPAIRGVLYADRRRAVGEFQSEDLEVLVATAAAVAARRSQSEHRIQAREAARIQVRMLPHRLPAIPGFEFEAGVHMCQSVGGDLYDCICREDGRCLLVVGDVSGKGLPAALLMGATSFLVRAYAQLGVEPLDIYARLHRDLIAKYRSDQFVALFLAELDVASCALRCVVAGLPRPIVIHPDGRRSEFGPTASPVALLDAEEQPPEELRMVLEPGDLLAVFTDGYPDTTPDGVHWLEDRVVEQLVRDRDLPLAEIRDRLDRAVDAFVGAAGPSDDRTLLLLRRDAA